MSRDVATPDVTEFIQCPYCNKDIVALRSKHNCKQDLKTHCYQWDEVGLMLLWQKVGNTPTWGAYDSMSGELIMVLEFHEVYNLVTNHAYLFKPEEA